MSLNDPNWGRGGGNRGPGGGNQGPPDLDELWRSFNRKLNELFGGRRSGSEPPRAAALAMRASAAAPASIAGVILAIWLASGFYIVVEGQRGVVLTFGKFSEPRPAPGLRWRLPWPIQSHELVNLSQVRTLEVGYRNTVKTRVLKESLMLTDDENIVDLQFAVQYLVTRRQGRGCSTTAARTRSPCRRPRRRCARSSARARWTRSSTSRRTRSPTRRR